MIITVEMTTEEFDALQVAISSRRQDLLKSGYGLRCLGWVDPVCAQEHAALVRVGQNLLLAARKTQP